MAADRVIDGRPFTAAAARIRTLGDQVDQVADDTLEAIGVVVQDNVQRRRARHRVTGKGERLVSVHSTGSGSARQVRVHAGGRVAHLIAGGTAPHRIRPIRGHALALERNGALVGFADVVRHPGTRADPFVAEGIADSSGDVDSITAGAARELVDDLARDIGRN